MQVALPFYLPSGWRVYHAEAVNMLQPENKKSLPKGDSQKELQG